MAENKGSHISWEWKIAIGWLTPHFKQNRCISIAIWNIKQSGLQYQLQKQPFFSENRLKWLKMAENKVKFHILGMENRHRLGDPSF